MGKKDMSNQAVAPPAAEEEEEDTAVVKVLKDIDLKYCAIETEFEQEMYKLKHKYFSERQAPLLAERAKILSDATSSPPEDNEFGTPACKGFWLQAIQNCDIFADVLEEYDEPVLQYLVDMKRTFLDEQCPQKGFKVELVFKENPFFTNASLWVEYHVDYDAKDYKPWLESTCNEMKACTIDWKPGKNVTVEVVTKKTKGGGAKKAKQKGKSKEEDRESFFRTIFKNIKAGDDLPPDVVNMMTGGGADPEDVDEEDLERMSKMFLEQLHEIGHAMAEEIIPYAVRFYTGEAGDKDDDDDEDEESEDEDDDDDDEEDSEDDSPPPAKGKKGKPQQKSAGKPAGEGKKEEECKQQ